jgi:predicted component of type VI protein secretion system
MRGRSIVAVGRRRSVSTVVATLAVAGVLGAAASALPAAAAGATVHVWLTTADETNALTQQSDIPSGRSRASLKGDRHVRRNHTRRHLAVIET